MLECLILGDSIAKGIAKQRPECVQVAQVGATSQQFKYEVINQPDVFKPGYRTVVISLGTNDNAYDLTTSYLSMLRGSIKADKVMWILPGVKHAYARDAVRLLADSYHDSIIEIPDKMLGPDHTHPTAAGYKSLAEQTKK